MTELRTPEGWLAQPEYKGVDILDPDGWDRKNFKISWNTPISKDDFERRMVQCTIRIAPDSPMHPRNIIPCGS